MQSHKFAYLLSSKMFPLYPCLLSKGMHNVRSSIVYKSKQRKQPERPARERKRQLWYTRSLATALTGL